MPWATTTFLISAVFSVGRSVSVRRSIVQHIPFPLRQFRHDKVVGVAVGIHFRGHNERVDISAPMQELWESSRKALPDSHRRRWSSFADGHKSSSHESDSFQSLRHNFGVMSVSFFSKFLKNETNMTLGCTELGNREWLPPVCLESGAAKRAFGGI